MTDARELTDQEPSADLRRRVEQWNQAMEELTRAYRAMASTHEMNTMSMSARDAAEGAKWG